MAERSYVGEPAFSEETGIPFTIRAEATSWNILDVLVQFRAFGDGGFEVRECGKYSIPDKTYYSGPDEEEAVQTFLSRAFGM